VCLFVQTTTSVSLVCLCHNCHLLVTKSKSMWIFIVYHQKWLCPLTSSWPHLRCDVIITVYNGTQRYEQFLQVGQLYWALILLSLALFRSPLCLRSSWCYIFIKSIFCLHPSVYLLVSGAWWDWPSTWLTNHRPSVLLWHCWLGHVTRKIVYEMTYNVSSGTLNTTIPYLSEVPLMCKCFLYFRADLHLISPQPGVHNSQWWWWWCLC